MKILTPKIRSRLDPFIQFGLAATAEAIKDSGINFEEHDLDRIGVSIGSGIGGLETIEKNSLMLKKKVQKEFHLFLFLVQLLTWLQEQWLLNTAAIVVQIYLWFQLVLLQDHWLLC